MYLHTSWKKFARDHDVEVGCLVNYFYEGDVEMSIKVFDKESCRIHYHNDSATAATTMTTAKKTRADL
jgi:hypothetical protein